MCICLHKHRQEPQRSARWPGFEDWQKKTNQGWLGSFYFIPPHGQQTSGPKDALDIQDAAQCKRMWLLGTSWVPQAEQGTGSEDPRTTSLLSSFKDREKIGDRPVCYLELMFQVLNFLLHLSYINKRLCTLCLALAIFLGLLEFLVQQPWPWLSTESTKVLQWVGKREGGTDPYRHDINLSYLLQISLSNYLL